MLIVNLLRKNGHNPNGNDTIIANYKEGLFKILRVKESNTVTGKQTNARLHSLGGELYYPRILYSFHFPQLMSLFVELRCSWDYV